MWWLEEVRFECTKHSFRAEEPFYGGRKFNLSDPTTFWVEPNELQLWWLNNVENSSKYEVFKMNATYEGPDIRQVAR